MCKTNEMDRRKEIRYAKQLPLRVQGIDNQGLFFVEVVLTENVSCYGACLVLNREVPVGQRLHIFISAGPLQTQASALIRWTSGSEGRWRVGVHFARPPKSWQHC
ncbi:MAG: PilZ domain-containing protein [Acidobacteriota bacterium]